MLESLFLAVASHSGQFFCQELRNRQHTKIMHFKHLPKAAQVVTVPEVPGLQAFYDTFASLNLYWDQETGESAYYLAPPSEWAALKLQFELWLQDFVEEDAEDLPDWLDDCLVVGEIPRSGNYLLIPCSGSACGKVFEFEHDGYEFLELGPSLPEFVHQTLTPDAAQLTAMASYLRFISPEGGAQWWILEMQDNQGLCVRTEV